LEFINRTKERDNLINVLSNSKNNNEVIIITGSSGVGKSELAHHVLESELFKNRNIRVRIPKTISNAFENNHYFNLLYKTVFNYVKNSNNPQLKSFSKIIAFNYFNIFKAGIDWLKNRLGFSESLRLSEPIYSLDIISKKNYIEKILSKNNYIICIENFQNIDVGSSEILYEIISQTSNLVFVFEYTLVNDNDNNILGDICNSIEKTCGLEKIKILYIDKLDFSEAQRLLNSSSNLSNIDVQELEKIYHISGGNLMHIILASRDFSLKQNPICLTIGNLSKNARYLLEIMYWLEREIDYNELFELLDEHYTPKNITFSIAEYENSYKELCTANVIMSIGNNIRWRHDSIITDIENRSVDPIRFLAYSAVKKYYLNKMKDTAKKPMIIERLFSLYLKYGDSDVVDLLTDIRNIILQYKYPNIIIDKMNFLEEKLIHSSTSHRKFAYESLSEICHAVGLADKAEEYLQKVYDALNPFHYALRAGILALKYYIPNCRQELVAMSSMSIVNPRLRLMVNLCHLFSIMMASRKSEGKLYAERLLLDDEYLNFIEYGILLRNYSELVDDIPESINILERALNIFKTHKCHEYEADAYIAFSMLYSYIGNFNLAENYLQRAVYINPKTEISSIYNNLAAISILKGSYNRETLKNLNNALLINSYDYDRCIIKCNLMIYYCLTNDFENATKLCIQIENSEYKRYNYDEFKHIIFTNLLYFSKCIRDKSREERYTYNLLELVSANDVCESVINLIKSNLTGNEDKRYFFSKFPFRVDFLGNWRFYIDKNISNN